MKTLAITLLAFAGCGRQQVRNDEPAPAKPNASLAMPSPAPLASEENDQGLICGIIARPSGENRYAVSFVIASKRGKSLELRYFHPQTFALAAHIDDKPVIVRAPAIDHPVQPHTVHVGPEADVTLSTTVTLSFGPGSKESDEKDPFRMWLDHVPARARLRATGAFDENHPLACTGWLDPA